jgi:hypothetical protein
MLSAMDATKYGLTHIGMTSSDSFSLSELHALSISMTMETHIGQQRSPGAHLDGNLPTRIDNDIVVAVLE